LVEYREVTIDPNDVAAALVAIRQQAIAGNFRVTFHALRARA
jgi:hypothetical protein